LGACIEHSASQSLGVWWKDCRDDQKADSEKNIETYALEELLITVSAVLLEV